MKTAFFAAILAAAPLAAGAMGCSSSAKLQTTMSCAQGTVLDPETNTCVAEVIG